MEVAGMEGISGMSEKSLTIDLKKAVVVLKYDSRMMICGHAGIITVDFAKML